MNISSIEVLSKIFKNLEDENGSYVYDTDLDEVADKFIEFEKKHNFDFI